MVFYWPDGTALTGWTSGNPSNSGGNLTYVSEGCIAMVTTIGLNDASCLTLFNFLCYIPN